MNSTIYIVGSGPGDPELLTLKAFEIIKKSDIIIYDSLVSPAIINLSKVNSKLIKVSKRCGVNDCTQSQIIYLLIDYVRKGLLVCRLKNGDPSVFGRLGEEILELYANNIQVEVIPGLTTGSALSSSNKLPLTHRKWGACVSFITGVELLNKKFDSIKWHHIIKGANTIVIYMILYNLPFIIQKCVKFGYDYETPIMLIQSCSTNNEKKIVGTLGSILHQLSLTRLGPPSIAIIGDIVEISSILPYY